MISVAEVLPFHGMFDFCSASLILFIFLFVLVRGR